MFATALTRKDLHSADYPRCCQARPHCAACSQRDRQCHEELWPCRSHARSWCPRPEHGPIEGFKVWKTCLNMGHNHSRLHMARACVDSQLLC